jgi:hypothetical protein
VSGYLSKHPSPATGDIDRRAEELDTLAAILPFDRRDQLASLLTDDDVATLKNLAKDGLSANTLKALASDLGYLQALVRAFDRHSPPPGRRRRPFS